VNKRLSKYLVAALLASLAMPAAAQEGANDGELDWLLQEPAATSSDEPEVESSDAAKAPPRVDAGEAPPDETAQPPSDGDGSSLVEGSEAADDGSDGSRVAGTEQATEPARRRAPPSRMVEEIIVTAQKREEDLQNVGLSVQAMSGERLDAMGINNPNDLPLAVPGMTVTQISGFTMVYIRGVGSDNFLMGDPNVATYIDGVYLPFAFGASQEMVGTERVEVLKGPQGTLFGRGANGGAINIITKNPGFEPELIASLGYDTFNTLDRRLYLNVPLTDTFALNFSGLYKQGDHYYNSDSRAGGEPLPEIGTQAGRIKALWTPSDDFELMLAGFKLVEQGTGSGLQGSNYLSILGEATRLIGAREQDRTVINSPAYQHNNNDILYGTMKWRTDLGELKFLASQQIQEGNLLIDFDGTPAPTITFDTENGNSDTKTYELQFNSGPDGGPDWLRYTAGLYYVDSVVGLDPVVFNVAGLDLTEQLSGGLLQLPPGVVNLLDAILGPLTGFTTPSGAIRERGVQALDSRSIFAQATISFSDQYALVLGGRYQEETHEVIEASVGLGDSNQEPVVLLQKYTGLSTTDYSFKPKVSFEFRPEGEGGNLYYLSYQEAIKGAQYNVIKVYSPPDLAEAEELDAWELGMKSQWFDGLLSFNGALFWYDITNLQVQFIGLTQGGTVTLENAGGARIRGADFEVVAQLFPSIVDGLVLTANGAYLDGKYTDYTDASGWDPNTGIVITGQNYNGNKIARTPEFSGTIGMSKTTMVPGGIFEAGFDYYYNAGYFFLAGNLPQDEQPAYGVLGARASYLYEPWNLRTTLWGRNITNESYFYGQFRQDFGVATVLAPSEIYGVKVEWSF
jgi:iron complex outermembrane recepter protein